MKEESRRLEVRKPRRDSQGHRPTGDLPTFRYSAWRFISQEWNHRVTGPLWDLPTFRYSKAVWLHFPQQPLVSFQLAGLLAPSPISPQWWQL